MKTVYVTIKAVLEYAKVFPENRDMPDNATHAGIKKMLKAADGQYSVNVYPTDEAELNKAFGPLEHEMYGGHARLKEGNSEFGVGKFFALKRKHSDIKETVKGEVNFGGAPEVVHWGEDNKNTPWSFEDDGLLGNGTEAIVKFSVYGTGDSQSVRLEKIGIVNHVAYEQADGERF